MPATYNGVASNVSLASGVSISEPVDSDAPNSASVNTPLSKLADYCEALRGYAPTLNYVNGTGQPAFANSWNNVTGYTKACFWQDLDGLVHLVGCIGGGAANTTAFTLPTGMRPQAAASYFPALDHGSPSTFDSIVIGNDGTVRPQSASAAIEFYVSFRPDVAKL